MATAAPPPATQASIAAPVLRTSRGIVTSTLLPQPVKLASVWVAGAAVAVPDSPGPASVPLAVDVPPFPPPPGAPPKALGVQAVVPDPPVHPTVASAPGPPLAMAT